MSREVISHIWTFSPASITLLERCRNAAAPPDNSNKWWQRFGQKTSNSLIKKSTNNNQEPNEVILIEDTPIEDLSEKRQEESIPDVLEVFTDSEFVIISKFDKLQEKSRNNPELLRNLAQNLPEDIANDLIEQVFHSKEITHQFLAQFFEYFLPTYIKKYNSRYCVDLLKKSHEVYPQYIKILLKEIIKDLDIQSSIIYDYITTLTAEKQTKFLIEVFNFPLRPDQFLHNLHNIHTAYKNCIKTDLIQNNLLTLLKTHSQFCTADKNYGKLFLAYLQEEISLKRKTDLVNIQNILEIHQSAFKRPCLNILDKLKDVQ